MRLARIVSAFDQSNPAVDPLVETAGVEVLQLDYVWPQAGAVGPTYAVGLLKQLRTLHKSIYLDPNLHLVTNAGGGDPRGCVEAVAQYLCEHGDAKLPVTAIRGDNVLPCLEELLAEGIELRDIATGTTLQELTQPLVAAQVELGAGPIATAWDEGSRFVVAGCYDLAAPMLATAVCVLGWSWEQVDELAPLAVAAHLPQVLVEFAPRSDRRSGLMLRAQAGEELDAYQHRWLLLETADDDGWFRHADVGCQIRKFELQQKAPGTYRIAGVEGFAASGDWLLRIAYQDGFSSEALLECRGDVGTSEKAVGMLREMLIPEEAGQRSVQFDLLSNDEKDVPQLLRVRCQSRERGPCEAFVGDVTQFSLQSNVSGYELTGALPVCQVNISQLCCPVPREAIGVSVDTRAAKEWR